VTGTTPKPTQRKQRGERNKKKQKVWKRDGGQKGRKKEKTTYVGVQSSFTNQAHESMRPSSALSSYPLVLLTQLFKLYSEGIDFNAVADPGCHAMPCALNVHKSLI
jgi:hypothetical protein